MLVADVAGARSRLMPGTRTVTVTELNHGSVPGSKVRCGEEDGGGNDRDNQNGQEGGTGLVAEQAKVKPQKPPLYKVLLLNDDYTPMEFVVLLLMKFPCCLMRVSLNPGLGSSGYCSGPSCSCRVRVTRK